MATDTFTQHDINATLGALEVGVLICMFLLGASTVQAYVYYSKFPRDDWKIKYLVASVLFLEWVHCVLIAQTFYVVTIIQYGHIEDIAWTPVSLRLSIVFSSAVSSMVQLFFADRVRRFSGNPYIFILCGLLTLWRTGVGIWATVGAMENPNIIIFNRKYKWSMMFYALGCTIDLIIAASLCYFLGKHRKTSIKKTARLVDNLIAWTIETGMLTGLTSVSLLICFVTMPNNFIWVAIYSYMDRVYSNSLLALLNARGFQGDLRHVVIEPSGAGVETSMLPRFAPVVTVEMTQLLDTPESQSKSANHFAVDIATHLDTTESRSSDAGHDTTQKDKHYDEKKRPAQ